MEKRKINKFIKFVPGINQSRADKQFEDQVIDYYDQSSFEQDRFYKGGKESVIDDNSKNKLSLKAGDVIISNSLSLAVVVKQANAGKVPSINFIKVDFKDDLLDPDYFIYLFNANKNIQRQKEKEMQGIGAVQRISLKSLEQLQIPYVSLDEQKKIGTIYKEMSKIQNQLNQYAVLLEQLTNVILEDSLNEKK